MSHDDELYDAPYLDVVEPLFKSACLALLDCVYEVDKGIPVKEIDDSLINRHFSWLVVHFNEGVNRHLIDGVGLEQHPLRTEILRSKKKIPSELLKVLKNKSSIRKDEFKDMYENVVRIGPTRISCLIKSICEDYLLINKGNISIPSPLVIVYRFLIIPSALGSKGYALLALRNFLFESINIFPTRGSLGSTKIDEELSKIWTSMRPRYQSQGRDKLPLSSGMGRLVREFLSLKGIFCYRFKSMIELEKFCELGSLKHPAGVYEFDKVDMVQSLPEASEISNELLGLPIPIRGADILFRGGLIFSSSGGLLVAVHGGPGSGKTSLALALGGALSPFGVKTLFLTAEESESDLLNRAQSLVPDEIRRMDKFPVNVSDWLSISWFKIEPNQGEDILNELEDNFSKLAESLKSEQAKVDKTPVLCRAVIVLDGLHDIFIHRKIKSGSEEQSDIARLYKLLDVCRELKALVVLNTGLEWEGESSIDYLVDVSLRLSQKSVEQYSSKPDRRITISKTRHQLSSSGTHSIQIAGAKGVRFSPQINYQLEQKAIWKTKLPDRSLFKMTLKKVLPLDVVKSAANLKSSSIPKNFEFIDHENSVEIFKGAHIFLNGRGSSGKAGLALKIAMSPTFRRVSGGSPVIVNEEKERILVVSFLYPEEYYAQLVKRISTTFLSEYDISSQPSRPTLDVIHLYPGDLKPNDLFNRIDWMLETAELAGVPFSCVIVDGIHNVFLQFPEIEKYGLFWPQLYSSLKSRNVTIITTHTTLSIPEHDNSRLYKSIDDNRSEPLRHTLIQKTDFQFEVDEISRREDGMVYSLTEGESSFFAISTRSAIGQKIPHRKLYWNRELLVMFSSVPPKYMIENKGTKDMFIEQDEFEY